MQSSSGFLHRVVDTPSVPVLLEPSFGPVWCKLEEKGPGHRVVTVFPDRMERYFSHKVFEGLRCG